MTPFEANYGFHPSTAIDLAFSSSNPVAENYLETLNALPSNLVVNLREAQASYKFFHDNKVQEQPKFSVGQNVWLLRRHVKTQRPSDKLDHCRLGPFPILERIGPVAYRLLLPGSLTIHPVFHVSLLEPCSEDPSLSRNVLPPPPVFLEDTTEYAVKSILDSRVYRGQVQYLIEWLGYGPSEYTWEPVSNLKNTMEFLKEFHQRYPQKPIHPSLISATKNADV